MRRCAYVLIIAATAAAFGLAACSREADENKKDQQDDSVLSAGAKEVAELNLKVADIDKRLKKIEDLLSEVLNAPPEPDPSAVYAVPIDGDPFVGPQNAKVTVVEAWDYS